MFKILNVLFALVIIVLAIIVIMQCKKSHSATADEGAVIDNIMTRTSIRAYTGEPVEPEKIETILKAAMAAPTAANKQTWEFVVIDDKECLKAFAEHLPSVRDVENAGAVIVVCGNLDKAFPGEASQYWIQDCSAASENLLLAAHALGLGAVWCGGYPMGDRVEFLKDFLKLPENIIPLNVVPIGYPAESPEPKDKWNPDAIHHNIW